LVNLAIGAYKKEMNKNRISTIHALLSLIIPVIPIFYPALLQFVTKSMAIYAVIFFSFFYFSNQIRPYKPADGITAFRLLIAVFLLLLIPHNYLAPLIIFSIIIFAEVLDGLDGKIARRTGPTKFGAIWDMETDAWFILSLSFITVFYLDYPWWILGFGLIRYFFYFIFYFLKPDSAAFPKKLSFFSKTICVSTVLSLALFWIIPNTPGIYLGFIILSLLLVSFFWEGWVYLEIRFQTKNR